MFWNLRAAGASVVFYDPAYAERLRPFVNAFAGRHRGPGIRDARYFLIWQNREPVFDGSWKPDLGLDLDGLQLSQADGRGGGLWSGVKVVPRSTYFTSSYIDVVPSYGEDGGRARASFALPDRPFDPEDTTAGRQKFAVVIDAAQYGRDTDAALTFKTPYVPKLNEFYGRNFHHQYDTARAELGRLNDGAVAIITSITNQRMQINAFRVFDWLQAFFKLSAIEMERSEPGLRCGRLIAQLGSLQDCRVLKIRGVRALLRKFGVDDSFTRSGAIEIIRDVDSATTTVGFDEFRNLYIEARETPELKPDDVLRFLLTRRVFRTGLELKCPNCQLTSWIHLDDAKTVSSCGYCDYSYDITPQLKDRGDWRFRRSGIFGRDDEQLGGVPVALTLQQITTNLHDASMYSTALSFRGKSIESCEADWLAIWPGRMSERPLQIAFGEAKSEGTFNAQDVRKLGLLADAMPNDVADAFIVFSKTGTFTIDEIRQAQALNTSDRRRVILLSRDELEPYHIYERSAAKLGDRQYAVSLSDMADATHQLYFSAA